MIDLSDDTRNEHLLGEEIHNETSNHHEELLKTTKISQKCEDVRDLALIGIIELVCADIDGHYRPLAVFIVILIGFYI